MHIDIGNRLKQHRQHKGLSQRALAKLAGVTNGLISQIEQNRISPSIGSLKKILDVLALSLADFFTGDDGAVPDYFYERKRLPDLGSGVKVARHHAGEIADPDQIRRDVSDAELAAIRELVRQFLPDADGALRSAEVCTYTNTPDEHFWIDRHPEQPQVMIASPCSGHGFKFSSVIGEMLAELLISGQSRFDLSLFRKR